MRTAAASVAGSSVTGALPSKTHEAPHQAHSKAVQFTLLIFFFTFARMEKDVATQGPVQESHGKDARGAAPAAGTEELPRGKPRTEETQREGAQRQRQRQKQKQKQRGHKKRQRKREMVGAALSGARRRRVTDSCTSQVSYIVPSIGAFLKGSSKSPKIVRVRRGVQAK